MSSLIPTEDYDAWVSGAANVVPRTALFSERCDQSLRPRVCAHAFGLLYVLIGAVSYDGSQLRGVFNLELGKSEASLWLAAIRRCQFYAARS
jgi:hypothetical protein